MSCDGMALQHGSALLIIVLLIDIIINKMLIALKNNLHIGIQRYHWEDLSIGRSIILKLIEK
jgi:hypothetical protein